MRLCETRLDLERTLRRFPSTGLGVTRGQGHLYGLLVVCAGQAAPRWRERGVQVEGPLEISACFFGCALRRKLGQEVPSPVVQFERFDALRASDGLRPIGSGPDTQNRGRLLGDGTHDGLQTHERGDIFLPPDWLPALGFEKLDRELHRVASLSEVADDDSLDTQVAGDLFHILRRSLVRDH